MGIAYTSTLTTAAILLLAPALASAQEAPQVSPPVGPSFADPPAATTPYVYDRPPVPAAAHYAQPQYGYVPMQHRMERPNFDTSIALHVTAVVIGVLGTIGLGISALFGPIECAFGVDCTTWNIIAGTSGLAALTSIFIGVVARMTHGSTRQRLDQWWQQQVPNAYTPTAWITPTAGGVGVSIRL